MLGYRKGQWRDKTQQEFFGLCRIVCDSCKRPCLIVLSWK